MAAGEPTLLSGWGRTSPSVAWLADVDAGSAPILLQKATERGAIVRGLGRSYGDAAQNGGGLVVRLTDDFVALDAAAATVTAAAGVSIDDLLRQIVPRGFFVPVTPGTRFVTVGGAIASDIHGKNHHVDGSFGNHLTRLRLLLADGSVNEIGPESDPELFWATVGGMGLTGVILDATFRVLPIETSRCSVDTERAPDLEALLALMEEGDHRYRYSVAWVDLVATGKHLGRSVLTRGEHATVSQLGAKDATEPLQYGPRHLATVPPVVPPRGVLNHLSVAAFNELWYRKAPRHRVGEIQELAPYFHPLDMVGSWNRLYGRHGLIQYQLLVPFGAETTLRTVVERVATAGVASFLTVLKRFGDANAAPLSFPRPGWTLTLDMPAGWSGLGELLHTVDRLVLDAGGRHYLAKDAHTTPAAIRAGYPRLAEWQAVQRRADPAGLWQSDLARRLELI